MRSMGIPGHLPGLRVDQLPTQGGDVQDREVTKRSLVTRVFSRCLHTLTAPVYIIRNLFARKEVVKIAVPIPVRPLAHFYELERTPERSIEDQKGPQAVSDDDDEEYMSCPEDDDQAFQVSEGEHSPQKATAEVPLSSPKRRKKIRKGPDFAEPKSSSIACEQRPVKDQQ